MCMKSKMQRYNLRLPADLIRRLEARKAKIGIPVSEQMRRAIEAYLKREE
jgi:predicted DNA-binding protein